MKRTLIVMAGIWALTACSSSDDGGEDTAPDTTTGAGGSTTDPIGATSGAGGDGVTVDPAVSERGTCLAGGQDFSVAGPYEVTTSPGPANYTIFHPVAFEEGCKHPVIAWGNGWMITGVGPHELIHRHMASWGFVVSVPHDSGVGTGWHHTNGLDWLAAQNLDPASIFYGKLADVTGVAGHSQGGQGANHAALHPSVGAVGCMQCITDGCTPGVATSCSQALSDDKPRICLTADNDTALAPTRMVYDASLGPAFYGQWGPEASHLTPLGDGLTTEPGIQYLRLFAAWFRCWIADDDAGCALFTGGDTCAVCSDRGWTEIYGKNL